MQGRGIIMKRKIFLASILAFGVIFMFHGISDAGICSISGQPAGCVKSVDIANRAIAAKHIKPNAVVTGKIKDGAVTSAKLAEDIVLGISTNSGSLRVEASTGADYLYASSNLYLGQSGSPSADVDLLIRDPFYPTNEYSLNFNASLADLRLGSGTAATPGDDGDIFLEDGKGVTSIQLNGSTGTVQNNILGGNGLVKAWAKINSNGTINSSWNCNTSAAETRRVAVGAYEVDFTPLSTNIGSRPRMAVLDTHTTGSTTGFISVATRAGDPSSVYVLTLATNGANADRSFTLIIY